MSGRHVPERTCIACGAKRPQRDLLRVASQGGGAPTVDLNGRAPGRGAYICRAVACADTAFKRRALERSLRLGEPLASEFKAELRGMLANEPSPVAIVDDRAAAPAGQKSEPSAAAVSGDRTPGGAGV